MKTIHLKDTKVKNEDGTLLTYAKLIEVCLNQPKQGGLNLVEIDQRLNILKKVKEATTEVTLDDVDATKLKELLDSSVWNVVSEDISEFAKSVKADCA